MEASDGQPERPAGTDVGCRCGKTAGLSHSQPPRLAFHGPGADHRLEHGAARCPVLALLFCHSCRRAGCGNLRVLDPQVMSGLEGFS